MAAPTAPIVGLNGKLYYNSGTFATPVWALISNVGDIKVTDELKESEIGIRGMGGFEVFVGGLRKLGYEWSSVYDPADTVQSALKTNYAARTPTEFLILDGLQSVTGSSGIRALFLVTKFSRQEELNNAMMVDMAIKPTYSVNAPLAYTAP